jgi:acetolactate synthase, small subunit
MMDRNERLYTISVFSENHVGLLTQLSNIFTRRCINIESVSASASAVPNIHKITLTCRTSPEMVNKVIGQIEKRIDVIRAFAYTESELVYQEMALYKISTARMLAENHVEQLIRRFGARILEITPEYTVIEKTGHNDETDALFSELKRYDIKQFVRSGRVAITRSPIEHVDEYLTLREQQNPELTDL